MDPYAVLNASREDSQAQIRKNYFQLAKLFHPDKQREGNSGEAFIMIDEAYKILSNKVSRWIYDCFKYQGILAYQNFPEKFRELEQRFNQSNDPEEINRIKIEIRILVLDLMGNSYFLSGQNSLSQTHEFTGKLNLRDVSNYYSGYMEASQFSKKMEIFRLAKLSAFESVHHYQYQLQENYGNVGIIVDNKCNFDSNIDKQELDIIYERNIFETMHLSTRAGIRLADSHLYTQLNKSFWNKKMIFYGGLYIGQEYLVPSYGFAVSPFELTSFTMDIMPSIGLGNASFSYTKENWGASLSCRLQQGSLNIQPSISYKLARDVTLSGSLALNPRKFTMRTTVLNVHTSKETI